MAVKWEQPDFFDVRGAAGTPPCEDQRRQQLPHGGFPDRNAGRQRQGLEGLGSVPPPLNLAKLFDVS